jgi:soluble lytic murein transglycosylase
VPLTATPTPIPGDRLERGLQAYHHGDYEAAEAEFEGILADTNAPLAEQQPALYWLGRTQLKAGAPAAAIGSLKKFIEIYPNLELTRTAQFNLGVAYEETGQFAKALTAYQASLSQAEDDPINAYIYERAGDAGRRARRYSDTLTAYQAGLAATDSLIFQASLREKIGAVELERGNPSGAIAQYELLLQASHTGPYRAKALRLLGEAHLAAGNTQTGYGYYLQAVNNYPSAYDSYLALIALVEADVPVDDFQRGLVDYYAGANEPALLAFERYLAQAVPVTILVTVPVTATSPITTTAPEPPYAADAVWLAALAAQNLGRYNEAGAYFRRLIDDYPGNPNWGKAHVELGKTLAYYQDQDEQAKTVWRDFATQNPAEPKAGEALWLAGRLELTEGLFAEAHDSLQQMAAFYPEHEFALEALYWSGQAAYRAGDLEGALTAWSALIAQYPHSSLVTFSGYWRARTLFELGRKVEAQKALIEVSQQPLDYYVARARELLADSEPVRLRLPTASELEREQAEAELWLSQSLGMTSNIVSLAPLDRKVLDDPAFRRGDALLELGLRAEAVAEFETVKENWWNNPLAMYQLSLYFRDRGLAKLSIITAARVIVLSPAKSWEEAPLFIQRLFYPIYFGDLILAEAEAHEVDPALLLAIMRQESLFEPAVESPAGARGLMQVMPTTGEQIADRTGFESFEADLLWRPYLNIRFGAWYISQQLAFFEGNQFAALAAYNGGPGNTEKWLAEAPPTDNDSFIEAIPFYETRLYVRLVYANLAAYRQLYGIVAEK